jgi:transcriptional regulator with XRE-family HTH domain
MTPEELFGIRKRLRLTQREFAQAIGYRDPVSISRWEMGKAPIPLVVALAARHLICVNLSGQRDGGHSE